MRLSKTLILIIFVLIVACNGIDIPEEKTNTPPLAGSIDVLNIGPNSATVLWDKATDADGDTLRYDLYFEGEQLVSNSSRDSMVVLKGLETESYYSGHLEVSDQVNLPVEKAFEFTTTSALFLTFDKLYEFPDRGPGAGFSLVINDDGTYILAYLSDDALNVMKTDSLGYKIWNTAIEFKTMTYYPGELILGKGGDIYVSCYSRFCKLDQSGKLLWDIEYCGDEYFTMGNPIELEDGRLFILVANYKETHLLNIDSEGEIISDVNLHSETSDKMHSALRFCEMGNGNFILAGEYRVDQESDQWIAEIDREGNIIWEKVLFEDYSYPRVEEVISVSDGGFVICGYSMGIRDIVDARIKKFSSDGSPEWDQAFRWHSFKTNARSIIENDNGEFIFCGSYGYQQVRAALAKLTSNGELLWKKDYYPDRMDYMWYFQDLVQTQDGAFACIGSKRILWYGSNGDEIGLWMKKVDENGN